MVARSARAERAQKSAGAVRSFFAVELGSEARQAASAVADALRKRPDGDAVRWVRAENLHVTLRFLGNVASERLAELARAVAAELHGVLPFTLRLDALHAFPAPRRPRVVALGLAPFESIAELAAAVERGVVAAGFEAEARPFRAHLTLGRVRGRYALPSDAPAPAPCPFEVGEIALLASDLSPSGPTYTRLERLPLGGDVHPETRAPGGT
ncbi:MAG: RNA 2',3'-cyclic phosphodiesterase [Deltaproteobacteria bacterium]|nr:MAG: RNA 2',3'-cyclic phosphodiesterase [Deltaproteobacteria bacterium]